MKVQIVNNYEAQWTVEYVNANEDYVSIKFN